MRCKVAVSVFVTEKYKSELHFVTLCEFLLNGREGDCEIVHAMEGGPDSDKFSLKCLSKKNEKPIDNFSSSLLLSRSARLQYLIVR